MVGYPSDSLTSCFRPTLIMSRVSAIRTGNECMLQLQACDVETNLINSLTVKHWVQAAVANYNFISKWRCDSCGFAATWNMLRVLLYFNVTIIILICVGTLSSWQWMRSK